VTKHYRSMSLRKSGHRGRVGNPSMPAEEDVKDRAFEVVNRSSMLSIPMPILARRVGVFCLFFGTLR
jgi:hypothetical protein